MLNHPTHSNKRSNICHTYTHSCMDLSDENHSSTYPFEKQVEDDPRWLPLPAALWLTDGAPLVRLLRPSSVLTTSPKKGLQGVLNTATKCIVSGHLFAELGCHLHRRAYKPLFIRQGAKSVPRPPSLCFAFVGGLSITTLKMWEGLIIPHLTLSALRREKNHLNVGSGGLQAGQRWLHERVSRVRIRRLFLLGDSEWSVHADETRHSRPNYNNFTNPISLLWHSHVSNW